MLSSLGQLLAPTRCVACGTRAEPPWCAGCRADAEPAPTGCRRCADPWDGHACPAAGTPWQETLAVWRHRGPARDVVAGAKARGAWAGWDRLGEEVAAQVGGHSWGGGGSPRAVTWVPGRPEVVRRRGIDHARVLAGPVAQTLDVPLLSLVEAGRAAGRRVGDRRAATPGPAFLPSASATAASAGELRDVLLVDDVLTTGATVLAVLDALRDRLDVLRVAVWTRAGADQSDEGGE